MDPAAVHCASMPEIWVCDGCADALVDSLSRDHGSRSRLAGIRRRHSAAVIIQRNVRTHLSKTCYRHFRKSLVQIQGRARGYRAQAYFRNRFSRGYRPVKIRIIGAETKLHFEHPVASAIVIVTLLSNENRDVFRKQIHRQESDMAKLSFATESGETCAVNWEEDGGSIKVPCTQARVDAVFTLISVTPKPGSTAGVCTSNSCTTEFLGQAFFDLHDSLLFSRRVIRKLDLGPCEVEPIDTPGSYPKLAKIQNMQRSHVTGCIEIEVLPCSHLTSKCGYVSEVPTAHERAKPSKTWFLVLEGALLRLFESPTDAKPRYTRNLAFATVKLHRKTSVLEIRAGGDWAHLISCHDTQDLRKWKYMIHKAALRANTRRNSQFVLTKTLI